MDSTTRAARRHLVIPDAQVKPDVPLDHIRWAAQAIVDYRPDELIVIGDWWDMPCLNGHEDKGSKALEGQRYVHDIAAGNEAFKILTDPTRQAMQASRRIPKIGRHRPRRWQPRRHFLFGNHEWRAVRAAASEPKLDGAISVDHMLTPGFIRYRFLERVWIDGIVYSHYFQQQNSAHPIAGTVDNRLNRIGDSFVQGHQQGFLYGNRVYPTGKIRHGLVAGSFYLHDEEYKGPQGNAHWRGIVVLNEVLDGNYCVMPLSMDYLKRRYA